MVRTKWYRRILVMVLVFAVFVGGGYGIVELNKENKKQEVSAYTMSKDVVIPGGMPVGIYMETNGVLVLGTDKIEGMDGLSYEPAYNLVHAGDYIVAMNGRRVQNKKELIKEVSKMQNKNVVLTIRRKHEEIDVKMKAVQTEKKSYKLGIWVRDNTQGLGTITFLNSKSQFGALGHGIHDSDTNELLEIGDGRLYKTSISDIQKGKKGEPGGMEGVIIYNNYNVLGSITKNTDAGIFGKVDKIDTLFEDQTPMEICKKENIKIGDAKIRCYVEGNVEEYDIRITKVDQNPHEINKGIVIEITDERLLSLTGGIIQGMSGSPIIQDGKMVGAVTHVFVRDSAKGYGIFIESMLESVE